MLKLLIIVLLHDINHFPFMHIFQESHDGLSDTQVLDFFCKGEETGEKARGQPSIYDLLGEIGVSPDELSQILFEEHHNQTSEVNAVIKSIIDSGVDVDKLSYLPMDAYFSGAPHGRGIDLPEILRQSTIVRHEELPHLGFTRDAQVALEAVVMVRYWNFVSLYWHWKNRALMAMLLRTTRKLMEGKPDLLFEYIRRTLWGGDFFALQYITETFRAKNGFDPIIRDIVGEPQRTYGMLFEIEPLHQDSADQSLYGKLKPLKVEKEVELAREFAKLLGEMYKQDVGDIHEDELLFDIPRREFEAGSNIYIQRLGHEPYRLKELSSPVRQIQNDYDCLAKKTRIFASPRIIEKLNPRNESKHVKSREWARLLERSLKTLKPKGQIE